MEYIQPLIDWCNSNGGFGTWVLGGLALVLAALGMRKVYSKKQSQTVSGKNNTAVNVQGDNNSFNTGVSKESVENLIHLLTQASDKHINEEAAHRITQNLLEEHKQALQDKEITIAELEQKIDSLGKRVGELLGDDNVTDEIKALVAQGDIAGAEKLVDSRDDSRDKQEVALAAEHFERGKVKELVLKYQQARTSFEKAAALQPDNTLYLNEAGVINHTLADYKKAIGYYEQALESGLKTYGEDHPSVAIYRNDLGEVYRALGEYTRAIGYYEQALESDLKTYGEDHPSVAIYRNNLGLAYSSLGEPQKAIGYYELALESDLKTYGSDHPSVARDRNNLGSAYHSLGEYSRAIGYYKQALESDLKTYGSDHPSVARDRNNLGSTYKALGEYPKAIGYFEQALESDLKTYGSDHPSVARDRNNLGGAYRALGEPQKAINYFEQALTVVKAKLGEQHPHTQATTQSLAAAQAALAKETQGK